MKFLPLLGQTFDYFLHKVFYIIAANTNKRQDRLGI